MVLMRIVAAACAVLLAGAGCDAPFYVAGGLPLAMPAAAASRPGGSAQFGVTGGSLEGDDGGGGWAADVRAAGFGAGVAGHGRFEAGAYGEDAFGYVGGEGGLGVGGGGLGAGLMIGYGFGGHVQTGHQFPLRLGVGFTSKHVAFRAATYAGWRFGVRGDAPAAQDHLILGWNTWGADAWLSLGAPPWGLTAGVTWDRMDDVDVVAFKFGATVFGAQ